MPGNPSIEIALGVALVQSGEPAAALAPLEHAVMLSPASKDAWNALGLARAATGDVDEAGVAFEQALAAAPRFTPALVNWCETLVNAGRLADAIRIATAATERHPDDLGAWFNLGYVQMNALNLDAARDAFLRSDALQPGIPATYINLGLIEQWAGRLDAAEERFRRARACNPHDANARFGLATVLLKRRRSEEGWALFAQGRTGASEEISRRARARHWDGRRLAQGTLIVYADYGFGDIIQFARFAPQARERVPHVVVVCSDATKPLLESLSGVDAVVDSDSAVRETSVTCAMSELPHLLGLGNAAFAPVDAYLAPPPDAVRRWSARIADLPGRRVGICWGGNPRPEDTDWYRLNQRRSIPAARLAWLADVPGVRLISLQKGAARDGKAVFGKSLADWTDELTDFSETAALIANLDVVISVDTSVAHCAGATGARLWMLDRFDSEWRWGIDAAQPGWYRTLRVFRQPSQGDWGPAVEALARAIAEFL